MLYMITGQPGNGKTLLMIDMVRSLAAKEGRPVYQFGIKDLTLPWHQLLEDEVYKWYENLPPNSILALDEGQIIFRPTTQNREPPPHVTALETHRHLGVDIFMTTQDPSFVHAHWRKLAGVHIYVQRKFGTQSAILYEWTSVQEKPLSSLRLATEKYWDYPKDVYSLYKSAEVHTHKRRIPKKLIFAVCLPFLIIGGVWYALNSWYENSFLGATGKNKPSAVETRQVEPVAASSPVAGVSKPHNEDAPKDRALTYLESRTPVLPGLPHTAPAYASITSPKRAPAPFACVSSKTKCQCYTDAGTRLPQVPEHSCLQIVQNGFYADWQVPVMTVTATAGGGTPIERGAQAEP